MLHSAPVVREMDETSSRLSAVSSAKSGYVAIVTEVTELGLVREACISRLIYVDVARRPMKVV